MVKTGQSQIVFWITDFVIVEKSAFTLWQRIKLNNQYKQISIFKMERWFTTAIQTEIFRIIDF